MKVFIDTNILVSAMLFKNGRAYAAYEKLMKECECYISNTTVSELKKVFNKINRAEEFTSNISIEKVMKYREYYSAYLQKDEKHNYSIDNPDYINRMNYYDNFVEHLTKLDQSFTPCKYFPYTEY